MFKRAIPVLHVSSSSAAEDFYCRGLGFRREFAYPNAPPSNPCYMGLNRDGVVLHVSSFPGDGKSGGVVNVLIDDLDALHAELLERAVRIDLAPTDQDWGEREMYVKDSDGNTVRFVHAR